MPKLEISKIHDAYSAGGECPICTVMDDAEHKYLSSFRGARVMAPEVRIQTNETGFCPAHYGKLYGGEGKLGLSLMVHTHLERMLPELQNRLEQAVHEVGAGRGSAGRGPTWLRRLFRKHVSQTGLVRLADYIRRSVDCCYLCRMLANDLQRYTFTVLYLWQHDPEFIPKLQRSQGFCLSHFAALAERAERTFAVRDQTRWLSDVVPLMVGNLERLRDEVYAFTQMYHHTVTDAAAVADFTALRRTLQKLAGRTDV